LFEFQLIRNFPGTKITDFLINFAINGDIVLTKSLDSFIDLSNKIKV